ncbi:hypothetical protein J4558_22500 [Leptolyngbya sp. 15MV]|nr:hypothetical protein J4558_22500 [Leptolyngbya sp. 15MV]
MNIDNAFLRVDVSDDRIVQQTVRSGVAVARVVWCNTDGGKVYAKLIVGKNAVAAEGIPHAAVGKDPAPVKCYQVAFTCSCAADAVVKCAAADQNAVQVIAQIHISTDICPYRIAVDPVIRCVVVCNKDPIGAICTDDIWKTRFADSVRTLADKIGCKPGAFQKRNTALRISKSCTASRISTDKIAEDLIGNGFFTDNFNAVIVVSADDVARCTG